MQRNSGGHGLRQMQDLFESHFTEITKHLTKTNNQSAALVYVSIKEANSIFGVGQQFIQTYIFIEDPVNYLEQLIKHILKKIRALSENTLLRNMCMGNFTTKF